MAEPTQEQMDSAAYRDVLLAGLEGASAARLAHLADRAILAAAVITQEFEKRFPVEYAVWNGFDEEETEGDTQPQEKSSAR